MLGRITRARWFRMNRGAVLLIGIAYGSAVGSMVTGSLHYCFG